MLRAKQTLHPSRIQKLHQVRHAFSILMLGLALSVQFAAAEARELLVGVYSNEPKIFLDSNGQAAGIFPDLLKEIAAKENLSFKYVPCEWQHCLEMLQSGELDLMPDVAQTEERMKIFDFHKTPALNSWSVIYRNPAIIVDSFLDLENRSVAVLKDSVQKSYLQNALNGFGVNARLIPVDTFEEGFREVEAGHIDAVAVNHHFGSFAAKKFHLVETSVVFLPSSLFIATKKGTHADLMTVFDYYFNQWREDPQSPLFHILKKWTGEESISVVPEYIWWALGIVSAAVFLALAIAAYLRREVKSQTAKVREGEERLDTILNDVGSGIYIKDKSLRYQYVNQAISEILGRPEDEIIGKRDSDFYDGKEALQIMQIDRDVIETGNRYSGKEIITNPVTQQSRTFFSVKKPLYDAKGFINGICGISTDVTDQLEFREKLDKLAHFDPLTGLHNRAFFFEEAERLLKRIDRADSDAALVLINIDNFKDLNDTAGHRVGDLLLKEIADQFDRIRQSNQILARIMGDSFAFLIETLPSSKGALIGEVNDFIAQVQAAASRSKNLDGFIYHGSASIGISIFAPSKLTLQGAFKQAELALYDAKSSNRGSFRIFETEMEELATSRLRLEAELRNAIDAGQLETYYQPQVNAQGDLLALEALVRWNHPDRGVLGPSTFVPMAEATGQIHAIGKFMFDAVCKQLEIWAKHPGSAKIVLAVNVSASEFFDEGFVHSVIASLSQFKFDPKCLELELTESQFIKNFDQALVKMAALKGMGVRLSLDDFGTGYSSLSRLKRLPFDQIKIDASFIRDLIKSPSDAAIVKTIVDLAKALGVEVLAEGVETAEQKTALLVLGCEKFQGYLNGAPMPLKQLEISFPELASPNLSKS